MLFALPRADDDPADKDVDVDADDAEEVDDAREDAPGNSRLDSDVNDASRPLADRLGSTVGRTCSWPHCARGFAMLPLLDAVPAAADVDVDEDEDEAAPRADAGGREEGGTPSKSCVHVAVSLASSSDTIVDSCGSVPRSPTACNGVRNE